MSRLILVVTYSLPHQLLHAVQFPVVHAISTDGVLLLLCGLRLLPTGPPGAHQSPLPPVGPPQLHNSSRDCMTPARCLAAKADMQPPGVLLPPISTPTVSDLTSPPGHVDAARSTREGRIKADIPGNQCSLQHRHGADTISRVKLDQSRQSQRVLTAKQQQLGLLSSARAGGRNGTSDPVSTSAILAAGANNLSVSAGAGSAAGAQGTKCVQPSTPDIRVAAGSGDITDKHSSDQSHTHQAVNCMVGVHETAAATGQLERLGSFDEVSAVRIRSIMLCITQCLMPMSEAI